MSRKIGRNYIYLVAAFSLVILSYSIWLLASAFGNRSEGETSNFYINMMIGALGLILALSSLSRLRGQMTMMKKKMKIVRTVVKCKKCDMKMIRDFEKGDFVNKEAGECKQCGEKMIVSSIYQEDVKS